MTQLYNRPVNTTVLITEKISITTRPSDLLLLKDGASSVLSVTFSNLTSSGICNFSFTPTESGIYTLCGDAKIIATVEVVSRTPFSYLQNLEDESLGSWTWNKTTGALELLRQNGTSLATFTVVDTLTNSSRERI